MNSAKGIDAKNASIGQLPPNQGKIIYKLNLTEDLAIIRMQPTDGSFISDFKAGQFVTLGVKLPEENKIVYRAYSISSAPEEKRYYEFYIKWALEPIPGKITSVIFHLNEGNTILWRKPAGTFTIEDKKPDGTAESRRMVLVSSGTGLAPFISYILHLRRKGTNRKIILLHGAKYPIELGYRNLLQDLANQSNDTNSNSWNFKYLATISRPDHKLSNGWKGRTGRVETLLIKKDNNAVSDLESIAGEKITNENSFFYICGYQGTVDSVISLLHPLGFVTNRNRRKDGTFDIKIESYG
jgi:ferredoxin/flavodoxin---NADP+ reductase